MKRREYWKVYIFGCILTIFAGAVWGISGALGQSFFMHYETIGTECLLTWKMLVAGVVLVAADFFRRGKATFTVLIDPACRRDFIIYNLISIALQYTFLQAIRCSNAAIATALQYLSMVMILLWTRLFGGGVAHSRAARFGEAISVFLAILGVFLISTHGSFGELHITPLALTICLLSAAAFAAYTIQPRRLVSRYGATAVVGWAMVIGGIFLFLALRVWRTPIPSESLAWGIVLGSSLAGSVIPNIAYLKGVRIVGGTAGNVLVTSEVVVAAIAAYGVLGSAYCAADIAGITLLALTVIIIVLSRGKNR